MHLNSGLLRTSGPLLIAVALVAVLLPACMMPECTMVMPIGHHSGLGMFSDCGMDGMTASAPALPSQPPASSLLLLMAFLAVVVAPVATATPPRSIVEVTEVRQEHPPDEPLGVRLRL